jgi:hypothetical protein
MSITVAAGRIGTSGGIIELYSARHCSAKGLSFMLTL